MVVCAIPRAVRDPSTAISRIRSGLLITALRRSRIGSSIAFIAAASFVFT